MPKRFSKDFAFTSSWTPDLVETEAELKPPSVKAAALSFFEMTAT